MVLVDLVGGGGLSMVALEAVRAGAEDSALGYRRPWDIEVAPE